MIRSVIIAFSIGLASCGPDIIPGTLEPTEVTVAEYTAFIEATDYDVSGPCWSWNDEGWAWNSEASWRNPLFEQGPDHPVTCVSRNDAEAYIDWLNTLGHGLFRLPTEAEWAAAMHEGWGAGHWDGERYTVCDVANINDLSGKNFVNKSAEPCDDGYIFTSPVTAFPADAGGRHDLLGNVWEWTSTCYDEECGEYVLRGGAWLETPGPISLEAREWRRPDERFSFAGFRLVRETD